MATTRYLTCCVCGDPAGRYQQHWNRDNGYGICRKCADWVQSPDRGRHRTGADEMRSLYGEAGINYEEAPACS